jgi:archaellum component FlaG (FlaF/FlaG flagellin family)
MKDNKFIISIVAVSFIILAAGIFFVSRMEESPKVIASQDAKAKVEKKEYDWGEIKLNGGDVKKTFTIKNTGTDTLQLVNVKTSCMCTTARVKINGESSPFFGMHAKSSWLGEVAPGEKAELEVIFDPAYHGPSGVGPITREVVVETNDAKNKIITFKLEANVVR